MRRLAELLEPVEAETPHGGRAVSFAPLGMVWLRLETPRQRERTEAGVTSLVEIGRAGTRADPRLIRGRVLRLDGADWTIVLVAPDPDRPGRVDLSLEHR
ncbi:MAG: phage head-tail adapter protein [Brevundimonas sp.]|uniref:phage head-tail adapter protein n=1 Tax=Brevundimonas sp. TaxID=1871086 RepID=UPI0027339FD6|nr:phage head-tail adapter protein [Brevundimonas sp.]MDP3403739.1 phage head-tail adapter protein [Brevundimonas sp.]